MHLAQLPGFEIWTEKMLNVFSRILDLNSLFKIRYLCE